MNSGIYMIKNLETGERYIGRSGNLKQRRFEHFCPSRLIKSDPLYKSMQVYGRSCFVFGVIEYITESGLLPAKEEYWIAALKPEYNINAGGLGNKGYVVSEQTKAKLSQAGKTQWQSNSEEYKQFVLNNNLRGPAMGHPVSETTKQKLRDRNLGKKQSQETINKRSLTMKGRMLGNTNGNKPICSHLNGVIIKEYQSTKLAANNVGVSPSSITGVLKGRRKTSGGFSWNYI